MIQYEFQHWNGKKLKCFCRDSTIDYDAYQSAINGDEYGFAELGLQKGDTVIDIGAYNCGEMLELAAMDLELNIISIDPSGSNLAMGKRNLEKNVIMGNITKSQAVSVYFLQVAIDGEEGIMGMVYGLASTTIHRLASSRSLTLGRKGKK